MVRILKEASFPNSDPTVARSSAKSVSSNALSARVADDEFEMFSAKKRISQRGVAHNAPLLDGPKVRGTGSAAATSKAKGKRKATDMDTSK